MEVEVKLRLPDAGAHRRVAAVLSPPTGSAPTARRTSSSTAPAASSPRGAPSSASGSTTATPAASPRSRRGPSWSTASAASRRTRRSWTRRKVGSAWQIRGGWGRWALGFCGGAGRSSGWGEFVGLGGFGNVRDVYEWKGLTLEVDETKYEFGTCYEIECESSDPQAVKKVIEEFLKDNGIEYKYSEASKFATFRSGKLPE
ncbi:hypothetical protein NL676_036215 [Syzygium grande]|nr:hypothetical protein NL676_036215 [Syzygium grande]